ncbi:hypothetical protein BT63DRAFT_422292 [Microthyrium microscopicum]|uniref:Altered inheritance of mitochondria protein 6 n=1 Tax=Microthyrium microscopicum TaxID=703497 RepID=A0A6A6UJY1_9PEZI|nr:hypothetical protein BT63DRAFT_422292 [Microthyrium microscopicum]
MVSKIDHDSMNGPHGDREDEAEGLLAGDEQDQPDLSEDFKSQERKYSDKRVPSLLERLNSKLSFRRRSNWLPIYELQDRMHSSSPSQSPRHRKRPISSIVFSCCYITLAISGLAAILGVLLGYLTLKSSDTFWPEYEGANATNYPLDVTRDITPVPCHSHNDYWRRIPLFDALHAGCISVEADVWHYGSNLYVGHDIPSLTASRTIESLYINPLLALLAHQNPKTEFVEASGRGVFDTLPSQTLVLLVDFKTEGNGTWGAVMQHLAPLRERGYLSYWDGTNVIRRAITVVGTGNTPFTRVVENSTYRDIFFDAPLQLFSLKNSKDEAPVGEPNMEPYSPSNSYYASTSANLAIGIPWWGRYSEAQQEKIQDYMQGAQKAGLKARYWDTPGWPVGLRYYIWTLLVKMGVDVLNVDDLVGATSGVWGSWG